MIEQSSWFSSWLSTMFSRHDSLSKSNDLHVFSSWFSIKRFSSFSLCFSLCFSSCFSIKQSSCFSFMTLYDSIKKIMQKDNAKVGKISIFNSLDVKLEFLTSRIELTQFSVESSRIKLKIWAIRLESSWKCEQLDLISIRVQNVNLKLDSTISLKLNYFLQVNWILNYFLWMICRLNCFLWAICKLNYFLWMIHELSCFLWVNWEWDWEEVTSLTLNEKFSSCWLRS